MPFEEVQQWVKKRVDKKPVQDPPSSPAYKAEPPVYTVEPPAYMAGPPAFMARRRTAELFTPEGRRNFVMKHLRLDPMTTATYEQAIQDGTHMVGMQGYGDLCETPQSMLDFWVAKERGENPDRVKKVHTFVMVPRGYLIYLEELTKARRRGEIERDVVALQEKAQEKFYRGLMASCDQSIDTRSTDWKRSLLKFKPSEGTGILTSDDCRGVEGNVGFWGFDMYC
ncbi:hypothetical protein FOQG_17884 [Fusarium oxysporum f. sp. raphani 54005]|uniref:Uncharacterized protein n=3 Tax=Fusarium oxysporum TaxID=5507 RepID=X0B5L3_FUSOX|nr:hypothetical protein FOMG_17290 [Fusarium oxysporum f. sp. melonis 26406]EXK77410.1 hypothetical protein FOQG_17884 [Fusarium oxysporum f. sp. raphani 54005]KAG7426113.1 hypothetical protein Forpi1262_v012269 [Fusarium oxysporum f. sp. raphani]KAJ4111076.1 hypothetical protein NW769_007253 [Fusarium oxysporum]KAJ4231391.1 hypothetical protein NW760_006190 [Fusarium oxysporum]